MALPSTHSPTNSQLSALLADSRKCCLKGTVGFKAVNEKKLVKNMHCTMHNLKKLIYICHSMELDARKAVCIVRAPIVKLTSCPLSHSLDARKALCIARGQYVHQ